MIASEYRYPGDVRQGSCDKNGQCSQDYTVHCQKCFDYCQTQGPGQYDTAVITLAFDPRKPDANVNKRPDPGNKVEKILKGSLDLIPLAEILTVLFVGSEF